MAWTMHASPTCPTPSRGRLPDVVIVTIALVLGALAPTGCSKGGEKPLPTAAASLDACALATRAEVESAMASPAGEPERRPATSGRGSACFFPLTTETGRRTLQVQIETGPQGRRYSPADISSFATSPSEEPPRAVANVGDAAYAADSRLHVLVDGRYLLVGDPQYNESVKPFETDALRKVALKAIERLPK
jgi:hypothetical protein